MGTFGELEIMGSQGNLVPFGRFSYILETKTKKGNKQRSTMVPSSYTQAWPSTAPGLLYNTRLRPLPWLENTAIKYRSWDGTLGSHQHSSSAALIWFSVFTSMG